MLQMRFLPWWSFLLCLPPSDLLGLSKNSSKAILDVLSQTPEILTLASSVSGETVISHPDKLNVLLSATLRETAADENINCAHLVQLLTSVLLSSIFKNESNLKKKTRINSKKKQNLLKLCLCSQWNRTILFHCYVHLWLEVIRGVHWAKRISIHKG